MSGERARHRRLWSGDRLWREVVACGGVGGAWVVHGGYELLEGPTRGEQERPVRRAARPAGRQRACVLKLTGGFFF